MFLSDTIAAISTGMTNSGIGIIRISGSELEAGRAVGLQNFALNVIAQGLLCGQQVAHALQCLCFHKMVPLYINQCKYFYLIHYKEICRFVN